MASSAETAVPLIGGLYTLLFGKSTILGIKALSANINILYNDWRAYRAGLILTAEGQMAVTGAMLTAKTAMVGLGLAIVAYGIYKCKEYAEAQKELYIEMGKNLENYKEESKAIQSLASEYDDLMGLKADGVDIEEKLVAFKEKLVQEYGVETEAVRQLTGAREADVVVLDQIIDRLSEIERIELDDAYNKAVEKNKNYASTNLDVGNNSSGLGLELGLDVVDIGMGATQVGVSGGLVSQYEKLSKARDELLSRYKSGGGFTGEEKEYYDAIGVALSDLQEEYDATIAIFEAHDLSEAMDVFDALDNRQVESWANSIKNGGAVATESIEKVGTSYGLTGDALDAFIVLCEEQLAVVKNSASANDDFSESVYNSAKNVDQLKSGMDVASDALSDFEKYGGLTSDTLTDLEGVFPGLISSLYDVDGNLSEAGQTALSTSEDIYSLITAFKELKLELAQEAFNDFVENAGGITNAVFASGYKQVQNAVIEAGASLKEWGEFSEKVKKDIEENDGGSTTATTTDPLKAQSDIFKEQIAVLEHKLFLQEQIKGTEAQQIEKAQEIKDALHEQAEWFRSQGLSDDAEYIRDLQQQYWSYVNYISDKNQYLQGLLLQQEKDALNDRLDTLNEQKDAYETAFSYLQDKVEDEIALLEDEMDAVNENYQAKIDALNAENDALDEQIELEEKLEALANAKNIKKLVYSNSQFEYSQDYDAISQAQGDLDEYNAEKALEDAIAELEANRDEELAVLQDKIDNWEDWISDYADIVDNYTDEQNKLIAEQVLGTDLERENWEERIKNAECFASRYNSIMSSISATGDSLTALETTTSSSDKTHTSSGSGYSFSGNNSNVIIEGFVSASDLEKLQYGNGNYTLADDTGKIVSSTASSNSSNGNVDNSQTTYNIYTSESDMKNIPALATQSVT